MEMPEHRLPLMTFSSTGLRRPVSIYHTVPCEVLFLQSRTLQKRIIKSSLIGQIEPIICFSKDVLKVICGGNSTDRYTSIIITIILD